MTSDVFVTLYQRSGLLKLRLCHGDGSIVNPSEAGYSLRNLSKNELARPYGLGDEHYFVLVMGDHYSLKLSGREVWSYGELPRPYLGLSEVSQFYLLTC